MVNKIDLDQLCILVTRRAMDRIELAWAELASQLDPQRVISLFVLVVGQFDLKRGA